MKITYILRFATVLVLFWLVPVGTASPIDPAFPRGIGRAGVVDAILRQPDGKMVIGGIFYSTNDALRRSVARFNIDGTVDQTFDVGVGPNDNVFALALQPDGKLIVGGEFSRWNNLAVNGLVRLKVDGTLDFIFTSTGRTHALAVTADGKILAGGSFNALLARFNSDGSRDLTFNSHTGNAAGQLTKILVQPDQKIYIAGTFPRYRDAPESSPVIRLNENGTVDTTFALAQGTFGSCRDLAVQPDGKVLVAGDGVFVGPTLIGRIVRFNANGTVDTAFGANAPVPLIAFLALAVAADGKIVLAGDFGSTGSELRNHVIRINTDGTADNSFTNGSGYLGGLNKIFVDGDRILCAGDLSVLNDHPVFGVTGLTDTGAYDPTSKIHAGGIGSVYDIVVNADGSSFIGGDFDQANGLARSKVAKLRSDGTTDETFAPTAISDSWVQAIAVQPDGKLLAGGQFSLGNGMFGDLVRFNTDGSLDTSFVPQFNASSIHKITVLESGQILVAGQVSPPDASTSHGIVRLNQNGSIDPTFSGTTGTSTGWIEDVEVQPDGKIIIGGNFTSFNGTSRQGIARLNTDGSLDPSLLVTGATTVNALQLLPDGKLYFAGDFITINGLPRHSIARLNTDTTLDPSFQSPLTNTNFAIVLSLALRPNGKLVIGGTLSSRTGQRSVMQLNENGTENYSIQPPLVGIAEAVAVTPTGRVLVGGPLIYNQATLNGFDFAIAQVRATEVAADFDNDGRSDTAVFRPSDGNWYILGSAASTFTALHFGQAGDLPTPADFDGDQVTDVAIFRPSTGGWYWINSSTGLLSTANFGQNGDVPRAADYDGDGSADVSLFRPSSGTWYRLNSSNQAFVAFGFGTSGDAPVMGDFDADGRADYCIYRPSAGAWYRVESLTNKLVGLAFGNAQDSPVAADYDGDGITDIAVFRKITAEWYMIGSRLKNVSGVRFGVVGDVPSTGDYDGDGRKDVATFRPSNGLWYLLRTSTGFTGVVFGANGDVPIENAYF